MRDTLDDDKEIISVLGTINLRLYMVTLKI